MKKDIVLMDGAVGSTLWEIAGKHGIKKEPVWRYNIEHPELVTELARGFIDAGSQIILANTFAANGPTVKHSSNYTVSEVVKGGVKLAKEAAQGTAVRVFLAIGPLTEMLEPCGKLSVKHAQEIYEEQIGAGMDEKPDGVLIQTFMDLKMMKIAAKICKCYDVPVLCTMTFEKHGRTLWGNSVQDIIDELTPLHIDGIGMNCSLGPDLALPIIKQFAGHTDLPLVFKPNAGMPIVDDDGVVISSYDAKNFANEVAPALDIAEYIGGCCGCNPEYIRELKKIL